MVHVTADGKVMRLAPGFQWENDLTLDRVPQAVKDAVAKFRPDAEILEVALGHQNDRLVYEVDIADGRAVEAVFVSEKGEAVKLEKKLLEHHSPAY